MVLRKSLIKGLFSVGALKVISMIAGLGVTIFLARVLSAEEFGQYSFIMALIPVMSIPVVGGLSELLTREVASARYRRNWALMSGALRAAHGWVVLISLIVLAAYWLGVSVLGGPPQSGKWSLLPIALLLVPVNGLNAIRNGTLRGLNKPVLAGLPVFLVQPLALLMIIALLYLVGLARIDTIMWGAILAAVSTLLISMHLYRKVLPTQISQCKPRFELSRWGVSLIPFASLALVATFNSQIGILLTGIVGTDQEVGALRIAERGAMVVGLPLVLINMVIAPHIVKAYSGGKLLELQRLYTDSGRLAFFLSLVAAMLIVLLGEWLISVVFADEYVATAYIPLVIIAVGYLVNVFCGSAGYVLQMSEFEKDSLYGQIFAILANVTFCLFLIPGYGAVGAAVGILAGQLVRNAAQCWMVARRLGIHPTVLGAALPARPKKKNIG